MNETFQTILIVIVAAFAVSYLVKKFIWNPKKKGSSKACGNDGCGC